MTGATSSSDGTVGYVNAAPPSDGYNTKYLRADGTRDTSWSTAETSNQLYISTADVDETAVFVCEVTVTR